MAAKIEVPEGMELEVMERQHIEKVLGIVRGSFKLAARALGVDRRTLYRRVLAWGKKASDYRTKKPAARVDEVVNAGVTVPVTGTAPIDDKEAPDGR